MSRPLLAGLALVSALSATGCAQATLRDVPMPRLVSGDTYEVTAVFGNVLGLPEQAAVKVDGATVGEVTAIETTDYTARVRMDIVETWQMPADIQAEIRFGSPMGEAFIELHDPEGGSGTIGEGGEIPLEATSQAPSVGDLLAATSALVTGGSFADMKVIIAELNTALHGNGGNIRRLVGQLDGMVTRLNSNTAAFDTALTSMERLGRGLARDREVFAESMEAMEPAIRTLSQQRKQILRLMAELRRLSDTATSTLSRSREDMLSVLADLGPVLETLTRNQRNFEGILQGIEDFGRATDTALYGLFLNFDLTTLFDQDALGGLAGMAGRQAPQRSAEEEER